uniref:Nucleolar protein 12 n=1 Tax=Sus scrofa TaxID=9823 RepID=A0A480HN12_PIG
MVVTVTVWLGWSYCTDSVFAVTSRSSSSASSRASSLSASIFKYSWWRSSRSFFCSSLSRCLISSMAAFFRSTFRLWKPVRYSRRFSSILEKDRWEREER